MRREREGSIKVCKEGTERFEAPGEHLGETQQKVPKKRGSRIIGRLLPAAVRLWLRSQVEQVESLSLELKGRDRQILSGDLPGVAVAATQAIYQGIHIGRLQLSASDIRINVAQVMRGKPLRLLQVFPVDAEVVLTSDDLNASLTSPLLTMGLRDFWRSLMQMPSLARVVEARYGAMALHPDVAIKGAQIRLGDRALGLSFYPQTDGQRAEMPIVLATKLSIVSGSQLQLEAPRWLEHLEDIMDETQGQPIHALQGFLWELGKDTRLTQLALTPEQLLCCGQIMVNP